ncbi:P-loop NTPase fold protein [Bradyrhizobium sp. CB1717]|uniref:P-loop NTPase fold protein n=1 Tax=Bradyrhizobium sp. CB1717 TaxID=3039154 RepID=UPI0024B216B5|nr:P-loop NTPase fold protein [Bradyrhizobium sp. CB1717]WFU26758.1 P-loop NTPase fold protein [Bradyrhizobium sp. CB1717]
MTEFEDTEFFAPARRILESVDLSNVRFSELAARILAETVWCLRYKRARRNELSSTSFVLTAFLHQRSVPDTTEELAKLRDVLASSGLAENDFLEMSAGFFVETPEFPMEPSHPTKIEEDIVLGPGFTQVLRGWFSNSPLPADVLLLMLLDDKSTGISKRIRDAVERKTSPLAMLDGGASSQNEGVGQASAGSGDRQTRVSTEDAADAPKGAAFDERQPRSAAPGSSRRHAGIVREATPDELGLNVEQYAKALATILRVSDGEFSFALFGRWGSGKTTLLKLLQPYLEKPDIYKKAVVVGPKETYADLEYRVVVHNAWKYRSPPESWVYLYKSLASAVMARASQLDRWAIALRVAMDRNGLFSLLASLIVLAVALIPIQGKFQLVSLAGSALGFSALIYVAATWMGASSKVRQLFHRNLRLVGRDENLGMLALIGEDVQLLLKAWTRERTSSRFNFQLAASALGILIIGVIWGTALLRGSAFDLWSILNWLGLSDGAAKPAGSSPAEWLHWAAMIGWTSFSLFVLALPRTIATYEPDKILLVVDDLDRCSPDEMLSVIENVRLLLDDKEINSRLQVLMLVDEDVLRHAIELRYAKMIEYRVGGLQLQQEKSRAVADIVFEQVEKLFACHLRLSRLSDEDVVELVTKLAGVENERKRKELERAAQAEHARMRAKADRDVRNATDREAEARKAYDDVAAGKPDPLVSEDGPSRRQRSNFNRFRFEGDFIPMTPSEVNEAHTRNQRIEAGNRRRASMTQDERLAERPAVVDGLRRAQAQAEAARRAQGDSPPDPERPAPQSTEPPFVTGDVRFSDAEIKMLCDFVPRYFGTIGRRPSPRSIKALLFKLQLARLLIHMRDPEALEEETRFHSLLHALEEEASHPFERSDPYALIVRQVL